VPAVVRHIDMGVSKMEEFHGLGSQRRPRR